MNSVTIKLNESFENIKLLKSKEHEDKDSIIEELKKNIIELQEKEESTKREKENQINYLNETVKNQQQKIDDILQKYEKDMNAMNDMNEQYKNVLDERMNKSNVTNNSIRYTADQSLYMMSIYCILYISWIVQNNPDIENIKKNYNIISIPVMNNNNISYIVKAKTTNENKLIKVIHLTSSYEENYESYEKSIEMIKNFKSPLFMLFNVKMNDEKSVIYTEQIYKSKSISLDSLQQKYDKSQVIKIYQSILESLKMLNDINITNGNLKPSNIILHPDGSITITDYCLNTISQPFRDRKNCTYYSPEILSNSEITYKSDIWSFGCIIHYLIIYPHVSPFTNENIIEYLEKDNIDILSYIIDYGSEFAYYQLVSDMLQPNPEVRPTYEEVDKKINELKSK